MPDEYNSPGYNVSDGPTTPEPKEDEMIIDDETSVERLMSAENLKNILKQLFTETTIVDTNVKKGSRSSANVYVNKKHVGKNVTVIIWEK